MKRSSKKPRSRSSKPLPPTFQGAAVVRGLGMHHEKFDKLIAQRALDQFDATRDTFVVVEDRALADDMGVVVRAFADEGTALRYARAMGCGNVDHRVLRVTAQTLVVATENEL